MNFNQLGMGNPFDLPQVPSTKELWKDEKSKYRHWMILFGLAIVALFSLALVAMVLNAVNIDDIKHVIRQSSIVKDENGKDVYTMTEDAAKLKAVWTIVFNGIQVVAIGAGAVLFGKTIYDSYKAKNFAKLSKWSTFIVGFAAFISVYNLFSLIWSGGLSDYITETPSGIYTLVFYILSIFIWALVSSPVSKVRRIFVLSEYVEARRNDPAYQQQKAQFEAMMKAAGQIDPSAFNASAFGPTAPQATQEGQVVNPATPEVSPERKRLEGLSEAKLKKVAQELSISGYTTMKKDELIEAILRVTKGDK